MIYSTACQAHMWLHMACMHRPPACSSLSAVAVLPRITYAAAQASVALGPHLPHLTSHGRRRYHAQPHTWEARVQGRATPLLGIPGQSRLYAPLLAGQHQTGHALPPTALACQLLQGLEQ